MFLTSLAKKLFEGNVFSHVCLTVHGGSHVTTTHDAIDQSITGHLKPPRPSPSGHSPSPCPLVHIEPPNLIQSGRFASTERPLFTTDYFPSFAKNK